MIRPAIGIALIWLTLGAFTAPQVPLRPLVLLNPSVIDVRAGTVRTGSIVVRDGRIAEIGARVDVPPGAQPCPTAEIRRQKIDAQAAWP